MKNLAREQQSDLYFMTLSVLGNWRNYVSRKGWLQSKRNLNDRLEYHKNQGIDMTRINDVKRIMDRIIKISFEYDEQKDELKEILNNWYKDIYG